MNAPIFIGVDCPNSNESVSKTRYINANQIRQMYEIVIKDRKMTVIILDNDSLKVTDTPEEIKGFIQNAVKNYIRMAKIAEAGYMG